MYIHRRFKIPPNGTKMLFDQQTFNTSVAAQAFLGCNLFFC
uniref:Uncharacterized protein n=1 Tax=Anguilla anguilla TaxID=7936 RepID=A0A0E9WUM6_ANGAN